MRKTRTTKQEQGPEFVGVLMGLTVAWNMYGFATGFFGRAWRDAPIPVTPTSYALNAAIAVFAPLARSGRGWDAAWSLATPSTASRPRTYPGVSGRPTAT